MAYIKELKLKSKIDNLEEIKAQVKKIAVFLKKEKITDYFFASEKLGPSELRLRKLENDKVVTLKIPSGSKEGIQDNDEYRFTVEHGDEFVSFLEKVGFKICCRMRKISEVYRCNNVEIELASIQELGNFIELKTHRDEKSLEGKKRKLLSLAKQLNLKEIEPRYYSTMLQEKEKKEK